MFLQKRFPSHARVLQFQVWLRAPGGPETEVQVPPRFQTDEQAEEQGRDDGGGHA